MSWFGQLHNQHNEILKLLYQIQHQVEELQDQNKQLAILVKTCSKETDLQALASVVNAIGAETNVDTELLNTILLTLKPQPATSFTATVSTP